MKRIHLLLICALCLASVTLQARTVQEAAQIASQFISQSHVAPAQRMQRAAAATYMAKSVDLVFTQYQVNTTTPAVYVFNNQEEEGFVLVSAEDNARAILGYSDNGKFDANNIPQNMQFWLQMYANEIKQAGDEAMKQKANGKEAIRRKTIGERQEASTTYPTISPILGNTIWGQGEPFNNKCPQVNGERCVTGCVATAISQIMYAHKYPTKGTGSYYYTTETKKLNLSANFGNTTYDWANMIPDYNRSYTTTQADAVSTLMYHVGVASNMNYTTEFSGAYSVKALTNLITYFNYDASIQTWLKDYMDESSILDAIATDLKSGRPVFIGGVTKNKEGHAFVCDGMQSNGYLHINWGWYGISNGYFALSALDPGEQGIGGSTGSYAFTESIEVYTGIQPNKGGKSKPFLTIDALARTSGKEIGRNRKVSFQLDGFYNMGIGPVNGLLGYHIYDENNNLVTTVDYVQIEGLQTWYGSDSYTISQAIPSTLANGQYELEVAYTNEYGEHCPIYVQKKGIVRFPMTVTSSTIKFDEVSNDNTPTNLATITKADCSYVLNSSNNTWDIDLYSNFFWNDYPSDNEVLIRLHINSGSSTSVIGSYVWDPTNSGAAGTINADALYAIGYYGYCYQYSPSDMHLTIMPGENGTLVIQYYMVVNEKTFQHSFTTTEANWYAHDVNSDTYYYYHDYVTYTLASSLKASKALQLTSALSHTNLTDMSYFVRGTISNIRNTAAQIAQNKTANFDISDNGATNNQFYCHHTKWYGNVDFNTGHEIAVGDEVVILGQLQNNNGNTPEIKGYICQHTDRFGNKTNIENITAQEVVAIYDLMGRKWNDIDNLPAGIYIINTNEGVKKIHINKQ